MPPPSALPGNGETGVRRRSAGTRSGRQRCDIGNISNPSKSAARNHRAGVPFAGKSASGGVRLDHEKSRSGGARPLRRGRGRRTRTLNKGFGDPRVTITPCPYMPAGESLTNKGYYTLSAWTCQAENAPRALKPCTSPARAGGKVRRGQILSARDGGRERSDAHVLCKPARRAPRFCRGPGGRIAAAKTLLCQNPQRRLSSCACPRPFAALPFCADPPDARNGTARIGNVRPGLQSFFKSSLDSASDHN